MNLDRIYVLAVLGVLLFPDQSFAQSCDAHFSFDGDLSDSGVNGYGGQMIGKDGTLSKPQFAEGKIGQSLKLDGSSAMRAFVDLSYDGCPEITFTAWIKVESTAAKGDQYLISSGSGSGPGLRALGSTIILRGSGNGLWHREALRVGAGWAFAAGVYDYSNKTYRLHWRNRQMEGKLNVSHKPIV